MKKPSRLKRRGYLASTLSVSLLGFVSWKSASADFVLLICLVAGMLLSVVGMELRWRSHRLEQAQKEE
jgi:hypothetical protein